MRITLSGRRQAMTDKLLKKILENKDSKLRMFTSPTKYQMLQPQEVTQVQLGFQDSLTHLRLHIVVANATHPSKLHVPVHA